MGVDLRVLGPLEAVVDGLPSRLGGPLAKSLLAVLLCANRRPVPADVLVEEAWHGGGKGSLRGLQVYVSQLRRVLRDESLIRSSGGGYLLDVEPGDVDASRFEDLLARGRAAVDAGDHAGGEAVLARALALWRGPAYADVAVPRVRDEARRLDELRLVATQTWVDAVLALGRHQDVVPHLQELVAREPTREAFRGQLILALYRCGRQAEAIATYEQGRRVLVEELGVDPGPELRQLHERVLRQDPGLVVEAAALRARRRLPNPPTAFVGREREIAQIAGLVRGSTRLVTITGPGGTGKTRLALAVAREVTPDFPGGVVFVDLSALRDHTLVPAQVAATLGLPDEKGAQEVEAAITERIGAVPTMLVIDNAEHVEEAAPFLGRLVSTATGATLLVTSRVRLRLYGEHEYPLGPLDVQSEAAPLFRARARATGRAQLLDDDLVQQVCTRLDGLPLAVELAAARTRDLTLTDMLGSLPRLELASDGPRDAQERQRTMEGAIAWSHDMLDEHQREHFAVMSVFAGGADPAAAAAVSGASAQELAALVDRNLLQYSGGRYTMLATVREFASTRLVDSGNGEAVHRLHAQWFLRLADEGDAVLRAGDSDGVWLDRLEVEHDNFRAALGWATDADPSLALELAVALGYFWEWRGHSREGREHLRALLRPDSTTDARTRTKALMRAGVFAQMQGDIDDAVELLEESLALARTSGDPAWTAKAMRNFATALRDRGEHGRALAMHAEARRLSEEGGDLAGVSTSLVNMADVALATGDAVLARGYAVDAVAVARELGHELHLATSLLNLGLACLLLDLPAESATAYQESLALCETHRYAEGAAYALLGLAHLVAHHGDPVEAARLLGSSDAQLADAGAVLEVTEQPLRDSLEKELVAALGDDVARLAAEGAAWSLSAAAGAGRRLAALLTDPGPGSDDH